VLLHAITFLFTLFCGTTISCEMQVETMGKRSASEMSSNGDDAEGEAMVSARLLEKEVPPQVQIRLSFSPLVMIHRTLMPHWNRVPHF
jgi:hypothetical protein